MTSRELYNKIKPTKQTLYFCRIELDGLVLNFSEIFCKLVKDAARCNGYNSDVYYVMKEIEDAFSYFSEEKAFEPIWVGFRRYGVDCTDYVLSRCDEDNVFSSLLKTYFTLYSIDVIQEEPGSYVVLFNWYAL
jgi:hypothetical protein